MVRVIVDLVRCAKLLDLALVHNGNAVRKRHCLDLVVGHINGCRLKITLDVFELGPHGETEFGIEVGQRFIHQEDLRLADDGTRKGGTLALAAGKGAWFAIEVVFEFDHLGCLAHQAVVIGFGNAAHAEREADVLVNRHVGIKRIALKNHGHVAVPRINVGDHFAIDFNLPGGRLFQAGDHAHCGGLAAA
jgi:hypothetical protein